MPQAREGASSQPALSVVVPVYNQAHLLARSLELIGAHLQASGLRWEVIVVSDGSTDDIAGVMAAHEADPRYRLIHLPANRGKGAAVRQGVLASRGARILFSDVDLSTPISEVDRLSAALDEGADIAVASRHAPGAQVEVPQPLARRVLGAGFRLLTRLLTDLPQADLLCGFKLFRRAAALAVFTPLEEERYAFDIEVIWRAQQLDLRVAEVPTEWRDAAESTVRPLRDAPPAFFRLLVLAARSPRRAELLLLLVAGLVLLVALGSRSLWGSEGRWAECARWMLLSGDLLTPRIDGIPYLLKPAPSYWLVVFGSLGGGVTEFSARAPSVLGALLAILATVRLGRLWYGSAVGLLAGAVLLTTGLFAFWARTASGDMLTVGLTSCALLCLEVNRRRPRAGTLYAAVVCCALASLCKGLLGFVLPAVGLGAILIAEHGLHKSTPRAVLGALRALAPPRHLLGAALTAAAIFLAPFVAERWIHGHWDSLHEAYLHSVGRFFGELPDRGGQGPLFYGYYLFVLAAPWSLWLPLAMVRTERRSLAWFLGVLAFFTLSSSRRSYYLLPILPPTALLIARAWLDARPGGRLHAALRRGPLLLLAGVATLACGASFFVPFMPESLTGPPGPDALPPVALTAALLALVATLFWLAFRAEAREKTGRSAAYAVLAFLLAMIYGLWVVLPATERYRTLEPFAAGVVQRAAPAEPIAMFAEHSSSALCFYLARSEPLDRVPDAAGLAGYQGLVIARTRELPPLDGWTVVLRERPAPSGVDPSAPSACSLCSARGRSCKHYLLIAREGRPGER